MAKREGFPRPSKTYRTYRKARNIISNLVEGNYKWSICVTEEGRYFPHIQYSIKNNTLTHFYFIEKGCCVTVEGS
jgi:hypothetical protein